MCPFCRCFSAKKDFAALVRSLPLEVMMPVNSGLTLMLPTSGCTERQHQPFAEVVTIADIKDEVELLPSLQKPKKVCPPVHLPVHLPATALLLSLTAAAVGCLLLCCPLTAAVVLAVCLLLC